MAEQEDRLSIQQKALALNLDDAIFGTIVEIGAGQEVARQFFSAGGAAGTIAKTMSAYDMKVSDEIYGEVHRYVSRERLEQMLWVARQRVGEIDEATLHRKLAELFAREHDRLKILFERLRIASNKLAELEQGER